jgi:CubicO group peptidase (beta-lactamase class C family)
MRRWPLGTRSSRLRSALADAVEAAVRGEPRRRHIQSIVVSRGGELVLERYFRDRRATDLSNLHSMTKSVLSTLMGIAVGDGLLTLQTAVGEHFDVDDERKARILVEHLLTMTSGLDAGSPHDIDEIADRGESWVEGPLAAPLAAEPGTAFIYNNGAAHVLGVLLARAVGMPLREFAEERLFAPLGIDEYRWPADPDGNVLGYGHLELRPRELVRLGELYLSGGRGLLPETFVAAATTAWSAGGPPEERAYGYLWWVDDTSFFAGGYGGQYLTVVPELELVVVTTGDVDVLAETSANLRRLATDVVIPHLLTSP